jgi:hypothetical protein
VAGAHLVQLDRSAVGVVAGVRGQYQVQRVVSKGQMRRARVYRACWYTWSSPTVLVS